MSRIAIITIANDLHARTIRNIILEKEGKCHIVEVDSMWQNSRFHIDFVKNNFYLLDHEGTAINIADIDKLWWRRSVRGQIFGETDLTQEQKDYINTEFGVTFTGSLFSAFRGKWISHPDKTVQASNKIYQMGIARRTGFNTPATIFSQDAGEINKFVEANNYNIIAKPVYGNPQVPIYTQKINQDNIPVKESLEACPTIYQEFIPGNIHYRVNVFGKHIYAFEIEAVDLDWRQDLTCPVKKIEIPEPLAEQIFRYLNALNLEMGIFDFKLCSKTGKPFFFEVNPQGNFLFLEGLTGFSISDHFANFLMEQP
jgi:glutathione synthase/RimK-type ligase-like ATP-grasp enzyme